ncbi:MAG: hypothetical protein COB59_07595 [Rhodospirillaceae bacterium]|nr:MAG: hypothetical protein COB59_07595 [Rhodospirillaceae bacterium]
MEPINHERYSRQILVPECGAAGQKKLCETRIVLSGDPSIIEPAAIYLRAAGCLEVSDQFSESVPNGSARAEIKRDENEYQLGLIISKEGFVLSSEGAMPLIKGLRTSGEFELNAAGHVFAIEILKKIWDLEPCEQWNIEGIRKRGE